MKTPPPKRLRPPVQPVKAFDHERAIGLLVVLAFITIAVGVALVVAQSIGPLRASLPLALVKGGVWLMVIGLATVVASILLGVLLGSVTTPEASTPSARKIDWVEPPDDSVPSTHLDTRRVLAELQRGKRVHRPAQGAAGAAAD